MAAYKTPTELAEARRAQKRRDDEEEASVATDNTARLRALRLAKAGTPPTTLPTAFKASTRRRKKVGPEDEDRKILLGETGANDD